MYELSVQREFCAAHAISIGGRREPLHGHNWRVTAVVAGPALDHDGLLCDFHLIERELERVIQGLQNFNLNETPPFDAVNPTAEQVARHIAQSLAAALAGALPPATAVSSVSVTEAPGCVATYRSVRVNAR